MKNINKLLIALVALPLQHASASLTLSNATLTGSGSDFNGVYFGLGNDSQLSFDAAGKGGNTHILTAADGTIGLDVDFGFTGTSNVAQAPSATLNGTKGFSLAGLGGLTSFTVTATYDQFISGRSLTGNGAIDSLNGYPWGFATSIANAGAGDVEAYNAEFSISNIVRLTDVTDATTATNVLGSAVAWDSAEFDSESLVGNQLTVISTDGFEALNANSGAGTENLVVRGLDSDGGTFTANNALEYYANTFEITITSLDTVNGFDDADQFVFSFDGDRSVAGVVPEPSGVLLLSIAGLGLAFRRNR